LPGVEPPALFIWPLYKHMVYNHMKQCYSQIKLSFILITNAMIFQMERMERNDLRLSITSKLASYAQTMKRCIISIIIISDVSSYAIWRASKSFSSRLKSNLSRSLLYANRK
jgi:hypothetical protein